MVKNAKLYSLFRSDRRGSDEIERKLAVAVNEMQTPENLQKLRRALPLDTCGGRSGKPASLDFSKFEEKLNRVKKAFFEGQEAKNDHDASDR